METPALVISQELFNPKELISRIPDFTQTVRGFFGAQKELNFDQLVFTRADRALKQVSYGHVRDVTVAVPPGLTKTYLDHLAALDTAVSICEKLSSDVLTPFQRYLAINLANPERFNTLRAGKDIRGFKLHNTELATRDIAKNFKTGGVHTEARYGDVVKRHADMEKAVAETNRLSAAFMATDRKAIMQQVTDITVTLDTLFERISEDPDTYALSTNTLQTLADLTRSMAREIEFYSVVGYHMELMTHAMSAAIGRLEKVLSKA